MEELGMTLWLVWSVNEDIVAEGREAVRMLAMPGRWLKRENPAITI